MLDNTSHVELPFFQIFLHFLILQCLFGIVVHFQVLFLHFLV
jgi:hypothetical protein